MNAAKTFRSIESIIDCPVEIFTLIMESGSGAQPELVLIERITGPDRDHVIPNVFAAKIELLGVIRMRRKIDRNIQLLVFDLALKYIGRGANSENKRQWLATGLKACCQRSLF
jgi:hypothetical protein